MDDSKLAVRYHTAIMPALTFVLVFMFCLLSSIFSSLSREQYGGLASLAAGDSGTQFRTGFHRSSSLPVCPDGWLCVNRLH
jgi:hypothetical protein